MDDINPNKKLYYTVVDNSQMYCEDLADQLADTDLIKNVNIERIKGCYDTYNEAREKWDEYGKKYKVALNSYRGTGGGELLTEGAGIKKEELKNRILFSTDKDLRYYLMKYVERQKVLEPKLDNNWKFIPEKWTINAAERDYNLLFGKNEE